MLHQLSSLLQKGHYLVFPSEIVSAFFLRALLEEDFLPAIRRDHMISWDQWKQMLLSPPDLMPASVITRCCFAQNILKDSSDNHTLSEVVDLLPFLPLLLQQQTPTETPLASVHELLHPYQAFLHENQLFEIEWQPVPSQISPEFCFVAPDICIDFLHYQKAIPPSSIIPLQDFSPHSQPRLCRFQSAKEEVTTVMQEVYELLHQGTHAKDIVLTVADLPLYAPHLQNAADQYGVPLHIAQSQSLAMSEGAVLFSLLEQLRRNELDCDSLELLFLEPSLEWKDIKIYREIIRLGKLHHCTRGTTTFTSDRWLSFLPPDCQDKYRIIKKLVRSLTRHSSFASLWQELNIFIHAELAETSCNILPLNMAMQQLRRLISAEQHLHIRMHRHWQLFLFLLQRMPYIPGNPRQSVDVYPYQVSALINPRFHFLLNMNHHATRVNASALHFLSDYLMTQLQLSPRSITEEYLYAYRCSGENIHMSCSASCFGTNHPPALPLINAAIQEPSHTYRQEEKAWRQAAEFPTPTPWQYQSLQAYLARRVPGSNYRRQALHSPMPFDHFSATSLDNFQKAPFAFLLQQHNLDPFLQSPLDKLYARVGDIYHRVLARIFLPFLDNPLPSTVDFRLLKDHLDAQWEGVDRYTLISDILKAQAYHYLSTSLTTLLSHLQGMQVIALEKNYAHELNGNLLRGKIDIVLASEHDWMIIDYKRSRTPTHKTHAASKGESIQIPFYLWMLHKHHPDKTLRAQYYSILTLKFPRNRRDKDQSIDEEYLHTLVAHINRGDFTCPSPPCKACPFPSLCRRDYLDE